MLEPHVIVVAAHLLEDLVADGALKVAANCHVQRAHVAPRVIAVCEALAALDAAHHPVRFQRQLGSNRI